MADNIPILPSHDRADTRRITEIRWHARGGQGAKTASTFLAESAVDAGYFAQGFPEYGPERMGAPVRAYNRLSLNPLRLNTAVRSPGIVIVLDDGLLETVDVAEGTTNDVIFLVNVEIRPTDSADAKLRDRIGSRGTLFVVDANRIAIETIGRPIPNMPMVGAMLRATGILPLETVVEVLGHKLANKKFPAEIVEGNLRAVRRGYEEVTEL